MTSEDQVEYDGRSYAGLDLSDQHAAQLGGSAVDPGIALRRGYRTIRERVNYPSEYKTYQQRVPALDCPMYSPDSETVRHQVRPDCPRRDRDGKIIKYDSPTGVRMVIDVHPDFLDEVRTGTSPLFVTEGIKTGDSMNSRGVPTIVLAGVWNWVNQDGPLPCWDHVRLDGRRVFVAFDSDVMAKGEVQKALARLIGFLESRGADVLAVYLPDSPDGSKQGVDDFLAAGHTVAEVNLLARSFDPDEFAEIRARRDPELHEAIGRLWARFWAEEWPGRAGCTRRDLYVALIRAAGRHGKITPAGIEVSVSVRDLALSSAIGSLRTVRKGLNVLIGRCLVSRLESRPRQRHICATYVLSTPGREGRARVTHKSKQARDEQGKNGVSKGSGDPGVSPLRGPRLRWSRPGSPRRRGLVRGTRRPRQGVRSDVDAIARLGKVAGAIIDLLDREGRGMTVHELARDTNHKRPRDLARRQIRDLADRGIVTLDGETVRLVEDWQAAIEVERQISGEVETETLQRAKFDRERRAFRTNIEAVEVPEVEWTLEDHEQAWRRRTSASLRPALSSLAVAVRDYLEMNPLDATAKPGYLAATLWAHDLASPKPSIEDLNQAIEELGGDDYRIAVHRGGEDGRKNEHERPDFVLTRDRLRKNHPSDRPGRPPKGPSGGGREPKPDPALDHLIDCECLDCSAMPPRYVNLGRPGAA